MSAKDLIDAGRAVFLRYDDDSYVSWCPGQDAAEIRGFYTADDLDALAEFMRDEQAGGKP